MHGTASSMTRPGIVRGLPIEAYHAAPGLSCSGMADLARSPAHYYANHLAPDRPPRAPRAGQLEGSLAHCATLEPLEFDRRYVTLPDNAPRRPTDAQWAARDPSPASVAAMEWWRDWQASAGDRVTITAAQRATAFAQADAVRRLPEVAQLLSAGTAEVSAFWADPQTGAPCRCRPDWVHPVSRRRVILLDLKTCGDASPAGFARQIARKGYARQAAHYSDGYAAASRRDVAAFVFAAVESEPPYAACAFMLDDEAIDRARTDCRRLVDLYAACTTSGQWPGYSGGIEIVSLPPWAFMPATTESTP